jgi:hypothetical protein
MGASLLASIGEDDQSCAAHIANGQLVRRVRAYDASDPESGLVRLEAISSAEPSHKAAKILANDATAMRMIAATVLSDAERVTSHFASEFPREWVSTGVGGD